MSQHLIVYAKRPLPGYAKTRLGASIGAEQAAGVYARLLYRYLLDLNSTDWAGTTLELSVAAPADVDFFRAAFPRFCVRPQGDGDLGQRMAASFAQAFAGGANKVVLTGSDIPDLNSALVRAAFAALDETLVVLGPAADGGYYLIGQYAPGAALFDRMVWSNSQVLAQTIARAEKEGRRVKLLTELADIDTVDEFEHWKNL